MNGGNKRNKSSHENNNAGIIYVATKRLRRGEKDTMDAIIEAYQNITVPQYVRNVGDYTGGGKVDTKPQRRNCHTAKVEQLTAEVQVRSESS